MRNITAAAVVFGLVGACSPPTEPSAASTPSAPAASTPAAAQAAAAPAPRPVTLTCDGPIQPTTTFAELQQRFGAAAVTRGPIYGAEGVSVPGVLIHADDPTRRLEIIESASQPTRILSVAAGDRATAWTGPGGLRVGSTLADVERVNGGPMRVGGFGWDYGGYVLDWRGGALAAAEDAPCRVGVRLQPAEDAESDQALGEGEFASESAAVLSQRPVVSELSVDFNVSGAQPPEPR